MDLFDRYTQHYIPIVELNFVCSLFLSLVPVSHLSDASRRRLVVMVGSARIQDETT